MQQRRTDSLCALSKWRGVLFAASMHRESRSPGHKTLIIGGGLMGCEEAVSLAENGHEVSIVEMTDIVAGEADGGLKQMIDEKLGFYKIPVLTRHSCVRIEENGAVIKDSDGNERFLSADTVLVAAGVRPRAAETAALRETCQDQDIDFISIGDCRKAGRIREAVTSGYFSGRNA